MYMNYKCWMDYIVCFSQNILCPSQLYRKFPCLLKKTSLPIFVLKITSHCYSAVEFCRYHFVLYTGSRIPSTLHCAQTHHNCIPTTVKLSVTCFYILVSFYFNTLCD